MVQLLNQTTTTSIAGNQCQSCGSLGMDAGGNNTTSAANTINGRTLLQELDGVLRLGCAVTQAQVSGVPSGNLIVNAPNTYRLQRHPGAATCR